MIVVAHSKQSDANVKSCISYPVAVIGDGRLCGGLGSAKLLHNSVSRHGLGNSEGLLGRFLHDHPREWWIFRMDRPRKTLSPAAYLTRLPYQSSPPLMATSWTLGTANIQDKILSRFGLRGKAVSVQVLGTMIPSESCVAKP
jgi:hypothetical protein